MGLFINSSLHSIAMHKRLTELEKLSEISTGILALKSMVEGGSDLSDRQLALENLARLMPMLSAVQQQFVIDEIMTPILGGISPSEAELADAQSDGDAASDIEDRVASSDYEMEFQLTLKRQAQLDVKSITREQLAKYKKQFKKDQQAQELERATGLLNERIEESWGQLNLSEHPKAQRSQIMRFLMRHKSQLTENHPRIVEAKARLTELRKIL